VDDGEDDPVNFLPGELMVDCDDCNGTGVETWCPKCGANLAGSASQEDDDWDNYWDEIENE
jgi:hypothetical protein